MVPPFDPCAVHWGLDPELVFVNHGSFGAVPLAVAAAQRRLYDQMEREPVAFFVEQLEPLLDSARVRMAAFVGCPAEDFAFVPNASAGVSTVIRSLELKPGDELLTSNHEYNACNNALRWCVERWGGGAKVVAANIPFPIRSPAEAHSAILSAVTERTRLVLLSHITSPTGIILPVQALVKDLQSRGIDTLVDGAHAPGFLPLNVASLGCAYYTGNFHKWLCAPVGSAFLYVRPDRQARIEPLIISHGRNSPRSDRSRFRLAFDFVGSMDMTPYLSTPHCVDLLPTLVPERSWSGVMASNRAKLLAARDHFCRRLGVAPAAPDDMLGAMATIPLPPHPPAVDARLVTRPTKYADALQDSLLARWRVQVPIIRMGDIPGRYVRISAQLYNSPEQYHYAADALAAEIAAERA